MTEPTESFLHTALKNQFLQRDYRSMPCLPAIAPLIMSWTWEPQIFTEEVLATKDSCKFIYDMSY